MKILMLDLETSPNQAHIWGLFNQNIGINQLLETSRVMCFAASWYGTKKRMFFSEWGNGHREMIEELHKLLSEADAVCHYNGNRFDILVANREFLLYNMLPPEPYHNIDLLQAVKKKFRFVSNKLDHVASQLGLGSKTSHEGHQLWVNCMNGVKSAQKKMQQYNTQDIVLLEKLYERLLPWLSNHPNHALYAETDRPVCTNCGSDKIVKKGVETTQTGMYQRFRCKSCGTPLRGRTTIIDKDKRKNILIQSKL